MPILQKLGQIPSRLRRELRVIRLLANWREAITAGITQSPLASLKFRNGVVIDGPPDAHLDFLFREIWLNREYSPPGYEIAPGDVVIDVGANLGVFTAFAAKQATGVLVYAYEPSPIVFDYLRRNVEASRLTGITLVQAAVAGVSGPRLFVEGGNKMVGHLGDQSSQGQLVTCQTLEDVFKTNDLTRCDLLKIDCEGAEYEIFETVRPETLVRVKRIVGEYHTTDTGNIERLTGILEDRSWRIDQVNRAGPFTGTFCATNTVFVGSALPARAVD